MILNLNVNIIAVLVATIAAYFVGAMWHGPLFGSKWMELMNLTPAKMKKMKFTPIQAMSIGFVITFIATWVLAVFLTNVGALHALESMIVAFFLWLGFSLPILAGNVLWEGRSFKLFLFNAIHRLVEILVLAFVLGVWR